MTMDLWCGIMIDCNRLQDEIASQRTLTTEYGVENLKQENI